MITKDNLTEVLNLLTEKEVKETMNAKSNYIGLWITGYGHVNLESIDINNLEQIENIESTGGIICDKDDFLRLFEESDSLNPFIMEYL